MSKEKRPPQEEVLPFEVTSQAPEVGALQKSGVGAILPSPPVGEHKIGRRTGGAFGGALKRRIERTDSTEKWAATNENDVTLLTPANINRELFPHTRGILVYENVLFTPEEYGAITISPAEVSRRIGANVLRHTVDRPPTERQARRQEVIIDDLRKREQKVSDIIGGLHADSDALQKLRREMQSPGYAHMTMDDIDTLMARSEEIYVKMFEAIVANRQLDTERTTSLTAAMEYLVTADDYKKTFKYWKEMSSLAFSWTEAKISRFTIINERISQELQANA